MLPANFIIVAVLLRFAAGGSYLRAVWRGTAQPSVVSWGFWSITALIAFGVQLAKGAGPSAFVTLAIGLSPLAVCLTAVYKGVHKTKLTRLDKWCIVLTVIGILLWLISKNPMAALIMSILADVFSTIPTLVKGYRAPSTEHPLAYAISILGMVTALLTITDWRITNWLFVGYILFNNLSILFTITVLSKMRSFRLAPRGFMQLGSEPVDS